MRTVLPTSRGSVVTRAVKKAAPKKAAPKGAAADRTLWLPNIVRPPLPRGPVASALRAGIGRGGRGRLRGRGARASPAPRATIGQRARSAGVAAP